MALKDILKLDQETDADMVIGDDIPEGDDDGSRIAFLSGKPNPKSTVAHRQKIKLNQTDRVSGRSPDHDVFERTPLVGGTPKTHLVLLVLLRCRIGLTPQSDVTITEFGFRTQLGKMCWYTAITMSVPKTIRQGCAPTLPPHLTQSD